MAAWPRGRVCGRVSGRTDADEMFDRWCDQMGAWLLRHLRGPSLPLLPPLPAECSRHQACLVTALQTRPATVRCVFYADTQICTHSLQAQNCRLLVREEATYIYRKSSKSVPVTLRSFLRAWARLRATV